MHNLSRNFIKFFEICKKLGKKYTNDFGNMPRRGVIPRFSDLEVVSCQFYNVVNYHYL
jgi:hypothetical protein